MKKEERREHPFDKGPQDLQILIINRFEESKKNDSLTKKWNRFTELEGNELEQLIDADLFLTGNRDKG